MTLYLVEYSEEGSVERVLFRIPVLIDEGEVEEYAKVVDEFKELFLQGFYYEGVEKRTCTDYAVFRTNHVADFQIRKVKNSNLEAVKVMYALVERISFVFRKRLDNRS